MINILSKFQTIAQVYTKICDMTVKWGSNAKTDGCSTIWLPPLPDDADEWVVFKTECLLGHEMGHPLTDDVKDMPKEKNLGSIYNWVRDVVSERLFEEKFPGFIKKRKKYYFGRLKRGGAGSRDELLDPNTEPFRALLMALLYRSREHQLNEDFNIELPADIEEIYKERLLKFEVPVSECTTVPESLKLTKEIKESLQMEEKQEDKDDQNKDSGKSDPQKGDQDSEPQSGDSEPQSGDDNQTEPQDGDEPGDEEKKDGDKSGDEKKDPKDGDSKDGDSKDGDSKDGDSKDGDPKDGDPKDGDSKDGDPKDGDEKKDGKESGKEELSKKAKEALKKVKKAIDDGEEVKTFSDDDMDEINQYASNIKLYRTLPDLQEKIITVDKPFRWSQYMADREQEGRKLTGIQGGKLKRLFISERAPRTHRNLRAGRLDLRRIEAMRNGSEHIYKKKIPTSYEDSAVAIVVDHSSSMKNEKGRLAHSILAVTANDLDKLRIPFFACGFTTEDNNQPILNNEGIRTTPITIHKMKEFEEPYRTVKHRFVFIDEMCRRTAELPAIEYATKRLAQRRETKKILFIMADGNTVTGNGVLDTAMSKATTAYIERIQKAGIRVVPIGIKCRLLWDCPDAIFVNDLSQFASQFYSKLCQILL